jgi:5-methylcytosine-specific restriction endonuclease McrA
MPGASTNSKLFARDRNVGAYYSEHFHQEDLTREYIIPFAQKGIDTWMNVVTACRDCNHRKSSRMPEQAKMPLLYTPYLPSLALP